MSEKWFKPETLAHALALLKENTAVPIAGGTDIMVRHRRHGPLPIRLDAPALSVGHLPELLGVETDGSQISVGAAVTLSDLAANPLTPAGLILAIDEFASPAVRNAGTLGGNICNASPAGDTLPFLHATGATLVLAGPDGERTVSIADFITGPGTTSIEIGELLVRVQIPARAPTWRFYRKVAPRRSNALSKLSIYAQATVAKPGERPSTGEPGSPRIASFQLALGAVAPTVIRLIAAEELAAGASADQLRELTPEITEAYSKEITPIDDQRSTRTYRRNTALTLIEHVLGHALPEYLEQL